MAAILTCIYLLLTYLSPAEVLPALAPLRMELWIGALAILTGLVSISQNRSVFRVPQVYLLAGLTGAVILSRLAHLYLGASFSALMNFLPNLLAFFMILFALDSPRKLRILAGIIITVAVYFTINGSIEYFLNPHDSMLVLAQQTIDKNGALVWTLRLRATGFLNDPNDLAQFLLVAIALLATYWRRGGATRFVFAVIPGAILVGGIALTKSRSGSVGLLAVLLLALSDKFGKVKAGILAAFVGAALWGLRFTGGRGISLEAGVDRLNIWRDGWGLFKHSPIWGIGFGWFQRYADRMTAHNSFVLCFTELGLLGYFFWITLAIVSFYQLNVIRRIVPETPVEAEAVSMAVSLRLALSAFLITGWFLSRTYSVTFYVLIAMTGSLLLTQVERKTFRLATPKLAWFRNSLLLEFASIVLVYIILKVRIVAL